MDTKKKVGLYLDSKTILAHPAYLPTLRKEIGLNLIIIGFSGELPEKVRATSPFDHLPPSDERIRELLCQHIDGRPSTCKLDKAKASVGPHVSTKGNDSELREAIHRAHEVGLEVWLLGGAWTASDYDVLMYCPSQERVNHWYETVYTHMATAYGVEGVDITHARFPMTSYPRGLFLCTCEHCAKTAAEMGYDMAQMKADILGAFEHLKRLDSKRLVAVCKQALGIFDFLQLLEMRQGIVEWFKFRSELLGRSLQRFRKAIHAAAGEAFIFGADTYPASLSMLVGHNQARWDQFSDFASPLLSHVDIFPMQTMTVWAEFLQHILPGITETEALEVIYRFVGYDALAMPKTIEGFALGAPDCEFRNIPLVDLVRLDMAKARLVLPESIPSYPIIQGGGAPHDWPKEIIEKLIAEADVIGHQGVIFQGTRSLVGFDLG